MSPPDLPKQPAVPKLSAPSVETPKVPPAPKLPKAHKPTATGSTGRRSGRMPAIPQSPLMKVLAPVMAVIILVGGVVALTELLQSKPNRPRSVSVFALAVGQCVIPPTQITAELSTLDVVACNVPHTQQVFALVSDSHAGDNYPGASVLKTFADAECLQNFKGFVGVDYRDSTLFYTYLLPSVRSWAAGDRTVTCVITTTGKKLTYSVQGSKL